MSIFEEPVKAHKAHPYYDDYDPDKLFLSILAKSGVALQGRELNQMQTILQDQIGRFANHMFKNATPVSGVLCAISQANEVDSHKMIVLTPGIFYLNKRFILVENFQDTEYGKFTIDCETAFFNFKDTFSTTLNTTITSTATSIVLNSVDGLSSSGMIRIEDELISYTSVTTSTKTLNGVVRGELGTFAVAHASSSVIYQCEQRTGKDLLGADLTFTFNSVLDTTYNESPTSALEYSTWFNKNNFQAGLKVEEIIISASDDTSLLDNAVGSENFNAPGADRYKVLLTLDFRPLNQEYSDFISLIKYQSGTITEAKREPQYSEILKYFSRSTNEVQGNFSVSPHRVTITEWNASELNAIPARDGTYALNIGSGVTYVDGYRRETLANKKILLDRGLSNKSQNFSGQGTNFKAYDSFLFTRSSGSYIYESKIFSITANAVLYYGFVRGVEKTSNSNEFRVYFSDVQDGFYTNFPLSSGVSFYNSESVSSPGSPIASGTAVGPEIEFTDQKALVYRCMKDAVDFSDLTAYSKWFLTTELSGTTANLDNYLSGEVSPSDSTLYSVNSTTPGTDVFVIDSSGTIYTSGFSLISGSGTNQISWSGSAPALYRVYFKAYASGFDSMASEKTDLYSKNVSISMAAPGGSSTENVDQIFSPDYYDVYKIDSVTQTVGPVTTTYKSGIDFVLIDGQTPAFFYKSGIKWLKNRSRPTSTYTVNFNYWDHQGSSATEAGGSFINSDSFKDSTGASLKYELINFYNAQSEKIRRSDIVDFRTRNNQVSIVSNVYTVGDQAANSVDRKKRSRRVSHTTYFYDVKRYLPAAHALYISKDGDFVLLDGQPATFPVRPKVPENGLLIANFFVPAYTRSPNEIKVELWESKRYKQSDIQRIDQRVTNLETFMLNNELEKLALGKKQDPSNTMRGLLVDDFSGHGIADVVNPEYDAAIDPVEKALRLPFEHEFFQISFDDPDSIGSNILVGENTVTLDYADELYLQNPYATTTFNVNPFDVFDWLGIMKLFPNVDIWVDTERQPKIVNDRDIKNSHFDEDNPVTGFNREFGFWNTRQFGVRDDLASTTQRFDGKPPLNVTNEQIRGSSTTKETTVFVENELRKSPTAVATKITGFDVNEDVPFTVDTTNNTLLFKNDHGLATGHKIVFNTDDTLPTGISSGTPYYFIYVSPNRGKLASSVANAEAGTAVSISTVGKGSHTVQKSLV